MKVLTKFFERKLAKLCDSHICVSEAMKSFLLKDFDIKATVLYDRPPKAVYQANGVALTVTEKHDLFMRCQLTEKILFPQSQSIADGAENNMTIQTLNKKDKIVYRKDKAVLLISSTSWTPDEGGLLFCYNLEKNCFYCFFLC